MTTAEEEPRTPQEERCGWESTFPDFVGQPARLIRGRLEQFVRDFSREQIRAWDDSIPEIQREAGEVLREEPGASNYSAILEYELPLESRRVDVLFLLSGALLVLELKGKQTPNQADIDQAAAYARDLRAYHRECESTPVHAAVVPMQARGRLGIESGVHIVGPDAIDSLCDDFDKDGETPPIPARRFLLGENYRPLPSLIRAARELFETGSLTRIHRAAAATDPAVSRISEIIHSAARTRRRALVLLTGVPGSGKTLVGLRVVHAHFLDDLAIDRADGKPSSPAVFLSGNGPLVEVLQYELRGAGGGGKAFVRGVKDYVKYFTRHESRVPPEHVLVFDEAQRAFDPETVADKHPDLLKRFGKKSEPELMIDFAERIPEWSVVLGLIGSGQEIHVGEEAGIGQWRDAVLRARRQGDWDIFVPPALAREMAVAGVPMRELPELSLDSQLRFHLAEDLHGYVELLLRGADPKMIAPCVESLEAKGYHLRITRDLEVAKAYLRDRYGDQPQARFGIVASSKDKDLVDFEVPSDFQSTKRIRVGPWYADGDASPLSCRHLETVVTEFGAQGLELDSVLLAWGTDLLWNGSRWDNTRARGYRPGARVRDPMQLRINAYRVLLTRGRDATVVFVPPIQALDATCWHLNSCGFRELD